MDRILELLGITWGRHAGMVRLVSGVNDGLQQELGVRLDGLGWLGLCGLRLGLGFALRVGVERAHGLPIVGRTAVADRGETSSSFGDAYGFRVALVLGEEVRED